MPFFFRLYHSSLSTRFCLPFGPPASNNSNLRPVFQPIVDFNNLKNTTEQFYR